MFGERGPQVHSGVRREEIRLLLPEGLRRPWCRMVQARATEARHLRHNGLLQAFRVDPSATVCTHV